MGFDFPEAGIDFERANAARIYDYLLGGGHNFRSTASRPRRSSLRTPTCSRPAVPTGRTWGEWCVEQGIDQFLDLGSGVPTVGNVHEIAHELNPDALVAYVDFEPVAVMHAREIVMPLAHATITAADLRKPDTVLAAPGVTDLLDLSRPVALLAVAVLHFIPDDDLAEVLRRYRVALAPGSVQAISHGSADHDDPEVAARMRAASEGYRGSASQATLRDRPALLELFDGLEIVEPGVVDLVHWPVHRPGQEPTGAYGVVGRMPRA